MMMCAPGKKYRPYGKHAHRIRDPAGMQYVTRAGTILRGFPGKQFQKAIRERSYKKAQQPAAR
jgi:hypothetical protein